MFKLKNLTIRKKLTLTMMGVCSFAVLLSSMVFYTMIIKQHKDIYRNEINSLALVIGFNCQAALSFTVKEDAEKVLTSLENHPSIVVAQIHDSDGALFADYGNGLSSTDLEGNGSLLNRDDYLRVSQEITMDGNLIGTILLVDDLRSMRIYQEQALTILFFVVVLALLLVFLLSARVCEIISRPIRDLAILSQRISKQQNYSLRASVSGAVEIRDLCHAFNNMLGQIDQKNTDLLRSEQRFRVLANQAVDPFLLHDFEGSLINVNQRACESLGYQKEELLGLTMADIDAEISNAQYRKEFWHNLFPESTITMESVYRRKDGMTFPVEARMGLLELDGKQYVMVLARDITERLAEAREKEELHSQLQQAQKMESIGTLAGGIAHDFNNILTPIYGYVELAMLKVSKDSAIAGDLRAVKKAAERAREMVQQILTFSRRGSENMSPIAVHIIVKEALKLLRASIPTTIEIKQSIDPHCGSVNANPTKIHQLLMNLCTNAYHAMRETGGILNVSVSPLEISDKSFIKNIKLKPGSYLSLEISDTGHGIDQATQERMFEPYFTTKPKGEGTGMGLSVVHGVVTGLGGQITVCSEPGGGTTFNIYLPVIKDSASQTEVLSEGQVPTGTETIMLVDDEESVRNVERDMLMGLGYDVKVFASPLKALESFIEQPDFFDLIVTDMTMPKMTGDKLILKILAIRPDIPVILCSGFSDLVNQESAKAMGISEYIKKPVTMEFFGRTVRDVLDGKVNNELT